MTALLSLEQHDMGARATDWVTKSKLYFDFTHFARDTEVVSGPWRTQAAE